MNQEQETVQQTAQETVPSPCQRLCKVEHGICQGCGRTLDEVSQWRLMSNSQKLAVWQRLNNTPFKQLIESGDDQSLSK